MQHQSFINEGFFYEVVVSSECEIFNANPVKVEIRNFAEMEIKSKWFSDHIECEEDAFQMLTSFAKLLRTITGKTYVIATKLNPKHEDDYDGSEDALWEDVDVMKMYVAEAAALKEQATIISSVMLLIKAKPKIDLLVTQANMIPQ